MSRMKEIYRVARICIDQNFVVKALAEGMTVRDSAVSAETAHEP